MPDPSLDPNFIFVFGSNLAGRHGKGAALDAVREYGAIYGQAVGLQGNSYAIPTKDEQLRSLPLEWIKAYTSVFIDYAIAHPTLQFHVTPIGCGLAGYKPEQIAPLFKRTSKNVHLPKEFLTVLNSKKGS